MLKQTQRLRSRADFRRVYTRGRSHVHPLLVLHVWRRQDAERRFGFSVSKKLGGSVVRNRIKRRLREACRGRLESLAPGFDAVVVARAPSRAASFGQLQSALDELLRQSGLL